MTVDLSKAKAGDIAVLRCGGEVEIKECLTNFEAIAGYKVTFIGSGLTIRYNKVGEGFVNKDIDCPFDIIEIKPAPFNWDTAEWGMAFTVSIRSMWSLTTETVHYIGCSPSDPNAVVVERECPYDYKWIYDKFPKKHLTRAPEHDIKEIK